MNTEIAPDFHLPTKMFINNGIVAESGKILSGTGSRAILITTSSDMVKNENTIESIVKNLRSQGIGCIVYDEIPEQPNTEFIDSAVFYAKKTNCDMIIGFGGLESINSAKSVALLTKNYLFCEELFDYTEKLADPLPLITIPTHPLFGFEILPLFFVNDLHTNKKLVYKNNNLYPLISIFDPKIPSSSYEQEIGFLAMSALGLSAESLISQNINEFTNTYALKSIDLTFKNLITAFKDPRNQQVRMPLMIASILSAIAFSSNYLSVSLSIALAISSRINVTVAQALTVLLPHIMEYNLTTSPARFVQMAKVMEEDVREVTVIEAAIKAIEAVRKLGTEVDIPQRLSQLGISKTEFPHISNLSVEYPFLQNALRHIDKAEVETILTAAY